MINELWKIIVGKTGQRWPLRLMHITFFIWLLQFLYRTIHCRCFVQLFSFKVHTQTNKQLQNKDFHLLKKKQKTKNLWLSSNCHKCFPKLFLSFKKWLSGLINELYKVPRNCRRVDYQEAILRMPNNTTARLLSRAKICLNKPTRWKTL